MAPLPCRGECLTGWCDNMSSTGLHDRLGMHDLLTRKKLTLNPERYILKAGALRRAVLSVWAKQCSTGQQNKTLPSKDSNYHVHIPTDPLATYILQAILKRCPFEQ